MTQKPLYLFLSISLFYFFLFCMVTAFAGGTVWIDNPYVVPNPTLVGPPPVLIAPPVPQGPPPVAVTPVQATPVAPAGLGWVYGPYCAPVDQTTCVVAVDAHGLNVRNAPNGYGAPFLSITNGTPLLVLGQRGHWLYVAPACNLGPTGVWSWTAGVPLATCL